MANVSGFYGLTLEKMMNTGWSMVAGIESETLVKGMLTTDTYTPNFDTHAFRNSITATDPGTSGTYTAGGSVLTTTEITVAAPAATQLKYATATSATTWTGATLAANGLIGYHVTGGADTTDELIWDSAFGGTVSSTAGTYTVTCPANGWWYVDYA